ncbi:MAG: hypothetical protein Q4G35_07525 [Propionibacteriaceae bacterium]|nr:hypothetical protein [Propionibacteriaceae bacterium]
MPIELIGTIAVTVVALAVAAGITARTGRLRPLVIGLGLAAIPVGLYLTGVLQLTINGIQSLVAWFQRTVFTNAVAWGLGLLAGGIVLTIIGLVLPKKPARERAVQAPAAGREVPPATGRAQSLPGASAPKPTAAPSKQSPSPAAKPAKGKNEPGEFDEIEELLRKRGIM